MAIVIESSATTQYGPVAATHTANVPIGVTAGDLLAYFYIGSEPNDILVLTGWTDISSGVPTGSTSTRIGVFYRIAAGTESGTIVFNNDDGSAGYGGVMVRISGHDATTPFNTNDVQGEDASANPFVLSAGLLTGASTDSLIIHHWGAETATRTISTLDADLTLIASATGGTQGFCNHLAYETGVTQNSAISTTMNDARDYSYGLYEIQAAAGGGGSTNPSRLSLCGVG